mgnify:CR=1 FL=1
MPSAKVLEQKKQVVAELTEMLQNSVAGVVVDYKGINVADDTKLRKELREAGVKYSVVKNTLLGLAAKNVGLDDLSSVLEGTVAADGSTVLEIYYDREYHLINFELDGGYGVEPVYARYETDFRRGCQED